MNAQMEAMALNQKALEAKLANLMNPPRRVPHQLPSQPT